MVVTGASTGIGYVIACHLASLGYRVFAGVRTLDDFSHLEGVSGVEPVMLDVTKPNDLRALVRFVDRAEPAGLRGLVNNAGVGAVGPIEGLELDEWRSVFEVNLFGAVAVTRALLPSLLVRQGRVINIGSGAGRLAFPLFGPYVASKFAIEGFSDVLRREIEPHGVRVVCVRPGVVATPIYAKGVPRSDRNTAQLDPAVHARYRELLESARSSAMQAMENAAPATIVAPVVARALAARRPRTRYVAGWDSRGAVLGARLMPDRIIDAVIQRLTSR